MAIAGGDNPATQSRILVPTPRGPDLIGDVTPTHRPAAASTGGADEPSGPYTVVVVAGTRAVRETHGAVLIGHSVDTDAARSFSPLPAKCFRNDVACVLCQPICASCN